MSLKIKSSASILFAPLSYTSKIYHKIKEKSYLSILIPASRLCRLAVEKAFQRQDLGSYLLMDAIQRVLQEDRVMAIYSLIQWTRANSVLQDGVSVPSVSCL